MNLADNARGCQFMKTAKALGLDVPSSRATGPS